VSQFARPRPPWRNWRPIFREDPWTFNAGSQRYGKSTALRDRVIGIAEELSRSGTVVDPAREMLIETRRSLVSTWIKAAEVPGVERVSSSLPRRAGSALCP
jgi:hypothetical protein